MSLFLISWQSIIAGVITMIAISIVMAVLGVALGFTVVKPSSDHPVSGLGTAFGLWSAISVIVSLAAGGFAAGIFAGVMGVQHGFMVWATSLLVATIFSSLSIGFAVRTVGAAIRSVGSGAASLASGVVGGGAELASRGIERIKESVDLSFDANAFGDEVVSVLRDTKVDFLQPEYLKKEMSEARADLRTVVNQLGMNTNNYEQIIGTFLNRQKTRLKNITKEVDRDTAVKALMQHRNISEAEASKAVDNALNIYNKAIGKAKDSIDEAQQYFVEAKDYLKEATEQARVKADKIAKFAARSALAAGLALILGAVICCWAGEYGSNKAVRYAILYDRQTGTVIEEPVIRSEIP